MFDLSSPTVYIPVLFLIIVVVFVTILHGDAKEKYTGKHKRPPVL